MKKEIITRLHSRFEDYANEIDGVEFWLARDLQKLLGYTEWRNFTRVIDKGRKACKAAGQNELDQFVDVNKMVDLGGGGGGELETKSLTGNDR